MTTAERIFILDACFDLYAATHQTITTLEFKEYVRDLHPTITWNQNLISDYLVSKQLPYSDNGTYRTYTIGNGKPVVDIHAIGNAVKALLTGGLDVTKTYIKSHLRLAGYDLTNFSDVFDSMNFVHTGSYTSDNHKIWALVANGNHYSKSKGSEVSISSMPKAYLFNAICKDSKNVSLVDILNDPSGELYKMLFAYLTIDIRNNIHKTISNG